MYLGIHSEMPFGIIPPPRANGALSQCLKGPSQGAKKNNIW